MRKLYATMLMAFVALTASAQQQDSTYVRVDFNLNPWQLPVSIPNRDLPGGSGNWSVVDDETGWIGETHTFDWPVGDETLQIVLTPSNYMLTDYDNAMVYTHNLNETDEPFETMLWTRRGSTMTFKAPASYWFAKVAFEIYRNWSSGSLYSGDDTNNMHIWGKDSLKNKVWEATGDILPCWSGDSVEWSLPECTGNTYFRYIDFWLLPRESSGITTQRTEARRGQVLSIDGILMRRDGNLEGLRKGIYIVDGKKRVVR